MPVSTPVLIVGGSLNGLSTALFLSTHGVPCVVVERHPTTSIQYKFRGISPRSMEIYRQAGVEDEIRAHRTGDQQAAGIARVETLASTNVQWMPAPWSDLSGISPVRSATCDQDRLEPILRARAERLGADVRFDTELVDLEQDDREIRARIRRRPTGDVDLVRASYLVVADGTSGPVRRRLGIDRHGPGVLQHWMNVIFDCDLTPVLDGRPFTASFVTALNGTFVPREDGRWLMALQYSPERGERAEDFDEARCLSLIRKGAGRPDLDARIVDARSWEVAACVADRFSTGRAFLVGDTAHVMPPTGGFGGNTGIHDGHNLAWKLAAVVNGEAGPRLLDTYDAERRPIAERTLAQALARLRQWFEDPAGKLPPAEPIADDAAVIFGYRYAAGALVPEEDARDRNVFEDPHAPSGRPGTRAPHLVVEHGGTIRSSLDLYDGRWTLLCGPAGQPWCAAVDDGPQVPQVQAYCLGNDLHDVHHGWTSRFGVGDRGAVLIRPDGFVAWRARELAPDPRSAVRAAMARLMVTT
jgi:2-polyprenyl-6-methoxyphenol hydroxylase-like FAD-dependent oxidoreductase